MKKSDGVDLKSGDFRKARRYLHPKHYALTSRYSPPTDLIKERDWDGLMVLPTTVLLESTSYTGSLVSRLYRLHSKWLDSIPQEGTAPYMEEVALLACDEFDALVFNAAHGWYRQAIGCLRNALEMLTIAAALSVTNNKPLYVQWRQAGKEIGFGQGRAWLRDSTLGQQVEADAAPEAVFGDVATSWTKSRYRQLCAYAHSQSGYNNADFWESNGPVYSRTALEVVEREFRATLALCYLLLRLGCHTYTPGPAQAHLLAGPQVGWTQYDGLLRKWLNV